MSAEQIAEAQRLANRQKPINTLPFEALMIEEVLPDLERLVKRLENIKDALEQDKLSDERREKLREFWDELAPVLKQVKALNQYNLAPDS